MLNQFSRTELLLGKEAMNKLENSRVAVFGIGGVGGYVCEALALKIKFLKHIFCNGRIKQVCSKVFPASIIQHYFYDPYRKIGSPFFFTAWKDRDGITAAFFERLRHSLSLRTQK